MPTFGMQVAAFIKKTKLDGDVVLRKIVLDVGSSLIMKSPVDTGRFRANWLFGVGEPISGYDWNEKSPAASQERLVATLPEVRMGMVTYLTNNLPYALALEYGHSKQAPSGMVRVTIAEFQMYVAEAVASVK